MAWATDSRADSFQMIHHLTDQIPVMPLFFSTEFTVIANRVRDMIATKAASGAAKTWNSHLWDVKR